LSAEPARLRAAAIALLAVGAALRTWQYAFGGALWLDEVALARGILDLELAPLLTQPLPHGQVAPKGFLLVEKLAALAFGSGDHALRLFPFVASLAALVAFRPLAQRMLDGGGPLVALALFAVAPCLISFGSTLKQYSSDVCSAVLLLLIATGLASSPPSRARAFAAGAAGAVIAWFSQPALLVLSGLGAALFLPLHVLADPARRRALLPALVPWGVSALAAAWVSLASVTEAGMAHQARFWEKGYPPSPIDSPLDLFWPVGRITSLYGSSHWASLAYPLPSLFVALTAVGFAVLWRRRRGAALLLLGPLGATLLAAWLHRYPFKDRLILFLVPVFLLALAAGIEWLRERAASWSPRAAAALAAGLVALAASPVALSPPPYAREDVVPVLEYLRRERKPGDAVYVYYGAAPAVDHYGARHGLAPDDYTVGGCHRGESARYLEELDHFRGRPRLWLLITHASRHFERRDILGYLDAIGTRRDRFSTWPRSARGGHKPFDAYLYDLSDEARLRAASARSFPLRGASSDDRKIPCGEGPLAMIPGEL
jgi:hypothetical protein